jgi:hypothetical protein
MSNRWRIVNPALNPAQVVFESGDEPSTLRECATRDASANGFKLLKSEDDGKTWVEAEMYRLAGGAGGEARAHDVAAPTTEKSDVETYERSRHEVSKKASK